MNQVIPSNVNEEAAVFRGCTASEMATILIGTGIFWGVVMGAIGVAIGKFMLLLSTSLLLVGLSSVFLALLLQHIKSGKPDGYYVHLIHRYKRELGIGKKVMVFEGQVWDVQRSKVVVDVAKRAEK